MYINTTTNIYPVTEQQIKQLNETISFPALFVPPEEYKYVFPKPAPSYNPNTQRVQEQTPVLTVLGHYEQSWVVTDINPEVIAANLASAKLQKNLQINKWRAEANQTSFTHLGKQIACDSLSRSDIDAVAGSVSLNGAFPVGFPNAWKAMDNTYLSLPDIDSFKAMYTSMTLQGTINFGKSQTLKTALTNATTIEEVQALAWE